MILGTYAGGQAPRTDYNQTDPAKADYLVGREKIAEKDSIGTNKVFNKLTDIGITSFPTTMKTVANAMPANSTLMLDSRDIIDGGTHEISDLGLNNSGMYMFMRGNSNARLSLLHIYGSTSTTTSYMNFGCYAATNNSVVWKHVDPSDFAPSGYGYGGAMDYIVDENGTFETKLDEILAGMESHSVKQFSFYDTKGLHSTKFYGRLWKYTPNYATLEAVNYNGNKAVKCKRSGIWNPWEWDNPPMTPGIEYRTTERFDGSPVYCGLVSYTNAENIGDKSSMVDVEIPHPFSRLDKPVRATGRQGGVYPIPNITSSGANYTIARVDESSIKLRLNKCEFDSRTWYFTIYYTK